MTTPKDSTATLTRPPAPMPWAWDDGGRAEAGYRGRTGDCVVRAIAIAGALPYQQVYDDLFERQRLYRPRKRNNRNPSPRTGVHRPVIARYLAELGVMCDVTNPAK